MEVEGVAVTQVGDHLTICGPLPSSGPDPQSAVFMVVFIWILFVAMELNIRYAVPQTVPLLYDSHFLSRMRLSAGAAICLGVIAFWQQQWAAKDAKDRKTLMFHQPTKCIDCPERVFGGTGVVSSLVIHRYNGGLYFRHIYAVKFLLEKPGRPLFEKRAIGTFRQPENAERVAHIIGDFLDVPVRNEATGAGV